VNARAAKSAVLAAQARLDECCVGGLARVYAPEQHEPNLELGAEAQDGTCKKHQEDACLLWSKLLQFGPRRVGAPLLDERLDLHGRCARAQRIGAKEDALGARGADALQGSIVGKGKRKRQHASDEGQVGGAPRRIGPRVPRVGVAEDAALKGCVVAKVAGFELLGEPLAANFNKVARHERELGKGHQASGVWVVLLALEANRVEQTVEVP